MNTFISSLNSGRRPMQFNQRTTAGNTLSLCTLIIALLFSSFSFGQSPTNGGFENGSTSWALTGTVGTTNARTGLNAMVSNASTSTSNTAHTNSSTISIPNNSYGIAIAWAKGSNSSSNASVGGTLNVTTSSTTTTNIGTALTRLIYSTAQNVSGSAQNFSCRVNSRSSAGTSTQVYFDDVIMYASTSVTPDVTKPTTASAFTNGAITSSSVGFSWTNGSDVATGIQNTIILRTTNLSAATPIMNDQGVYSVAGGTSGPNVVSTDWTVVSVSVASGATSYTDSSVSASTSYKYAVIHRDLAYNYSVALVSGTIATSSGVTTITSTKTGPWSDTATWIGGVIPTSADNAVIASGHIVTMDSDTYATRNSGTTTVVNAGGTLATSKTYVNNGTTTVNGSFQLESGGWVSDATLTNALVYGTNGTLIFNTPYTANSGNYWPTTSGPVNVTVNTSSNLDLGFARTVTGLFQTSSNINNPGNITIGTNGTLKLNGGYNWSGSGSPVYGANSLLLYNSTGSPGRGVEWNQSSGTIGTTPGYPNNVQISNNTTLNFANGSSSTFKADKTVLIDSGSALYQNYGSGNAGLIVGTDLTVNGNLTLGTSSGDVTVGGNFTVASTGFNSFGRAVIFNGSANQTITRTTPGTLDFDYITINKSGGNVVLSASPATDINLNATTGDFLRIISTGGFDLNGRSMSLNNNGGGIYVDGARSITSTVAGGKIEVNQYKRVSNNSGTGTLTLDANVTVNLNTNGNFDFGKSGSTYITTLNGTLSINSTTNCFVNTNPPIYGSASLLKYNSGGTSYGRGVEWSTTSGAGYPNDIQVTNNTTLDVPNTGGAFSTNLALARDLTIDSGSALYMDYGAGAASGSLTVGRNVNIAGALSLGDTVGGDMNVAGNWTNSGTFTPNGRAVTFNGATQTLTGSTSFDFLIMNNSGGLTLQATSPVTVNQGITFTAGSITIGANNINIPGSFGITTGSVASHIITNSTGRLVRTGVGSTARLFPVGLTATKYSPITLTNTTGTADLSVNVSGTITNTVFEPTQIVNLQWNISSTAATTATVSPTWQAADQAGSFTNSGPGELGNYTSAYGVYPVTLNTTTTTATGVALQSGSNAIVIGNTGAVFTDAPANDLCASPVAVTINAPATNGTLKGATITAPFTSGINDVWYKFDVTQSADYTVTVTGFTGDVDFSVFNSNCPTTSTATNGSATTTNAIETVTQTLTAGTYYVRVYSFNATASKSNFTIAVSAPKILSANGTTALDFGTVTKDNVSATQSFNASAIFLSASQVVTATAPANYEVALTDTPLSFGSTVSLTADSNGVIASTPIYVRFNSAAACGAVSGNVVLSATSATSVNVAVTATAAVTAPIAIAATNVTDTSFTANWDAVPGATSYELDVYTEEVGSPATTIETFTAIGGGTPSSYNTRSWTGVGSISWVAYKARTDQEIILGNETITLRDQAGAYLESGVITNGLTNIKFDVQQFFGGTGGVVTIKVLTGPTFSTVTTIGTKAYSMTASTYDSGVIAGIVGDYKIVIENNTSARPAIDNLSFTSFSGATTTTFVINALNVGNVTSRNVTGLQADTQYYYRVRAVTGTCKSANSNVISVLTDNKVIWNGSAWSNITGPTANLEAIIKGPFVTGAAPQNDFTAKKLTVATGGSVQITAGHYIKVINELVNNLTAAEFVVESDGNFWQTTSATNTGDITVKREITIKDNKQYNYLISPTGTSLKTDLYGTGNSAPFTLYHNEANNTFGNSSGAYIRGRGLAVKEPATGSGTVTALFKGVPMNEAFSFVLANSNVGAGTTLGYNLTGNPYPSNIDLVKLYNLNSNENKISSTFYFWDNTVNSRTAQSGSGYNGEAYAIFNAASGTYGTGKGAGYLTGSSEAAKVPTYVGKVGQGFMVQSKERVVKTLDFDNTIRNADSGVGFFGNATKGGYLPEDDRFWLNLSAPTNITNQVAIVYFEAGLNEFAQDDSELKSLSSDILYTLIGDKKAVINGRSSFVNTDSIPLGSNSFTAGTFTFSLGNKEGKFANGQNIYLKDKQTGIVTNLSAGNYTFQANSGESTGRFEIIYQPETVLATDTKVKENLIVYKDGNDFVVKAQNKKISSLEVFDSAGRLIWALKPESIKAIIPAEKINNGLYVLKINQNGEITSKKIIR